MKLYDVIIVGGGVTALGAAMYSGRLGMRTLVIGETPGGTIILTNIVENYPGFVRLTGQELADNLRKHALDYKEFVEIKDKKVTEIKRESGKFIVSTDEEKFQGLSVIYATGTIWKELKVPGHDEFKNKGVHYCALCDGFFYREKIVAVVGGSDSAVKDALVLVEFAKKVYIIYRGEKIRAEPVNAKRVQENKKIELIAKTNVTEIKGNDSGVTKVILDNPYKGSNELKLDGLFIAIGHIPLSGIAKNIGVAVNEKEEIIINRKSETNIPGFFAAGDVTDTHFKQAIIAVAEGVMAAYSAYEYIKKGNSVKKLYT